MALDEMPDEARLLAILCLERPHTTDRLVEPVDHADDDAGRDGGHDHERVAEVLDRQRRVDVHEPDSRPTPLPSRSRSKSSEPTTSTGPLTYFGPFPLPLAQ